MALDAKDLVLGKSVFYRQYDHTTGTFTEKREIKPNKIIILQGLHTFYLQYLRNYFDLKIFLAPHELIRTAWKIKRDVHERGYKLERVLENLADREHDARVHIQPQKALADWIILYFPIAEITRDEVLSGKKPAIGVRHTIRNDAQIGNLLECLHQLENCSVTFDSNVEEISRIVFVIQGEPKRQTNFSYRNSSISKYTPNHKSMESAILA